MLLWLVLEMLWMIVIVCACAASQPTPPQPPPRRHKCHYFGIETRDAIDARGCGCQQTGNSHFAC